MVVTQSRLAKRGWCVVHNFHFSRGDKFCVVLTLLPLTARAR
jgi:hypothetical protein